MRVTMTAALFAASGYLSAQCFQKVVAGEQHFIAISQDGALYGWGENSARQLGDGSTTDRPQPVLISSASWSFVSAGNTHTVAVRSDGTLWAWGSDSYEKLGNGGSGNAAFPQQIGTDSDWKEVAAGERASLAIKTDGRLYGWGINNNGYLGNGAANGYEVSTPVQIGSASDWAHIAGSGRHALAIKTNGTLWAWGRNHSGQVGNNTETDQYTPVQIGTANNYRWIDASSRVSFALRGDNTLWGWGFSSTGLGLNSLQPMQIGADSNWQTFSFKKYEGSQYALLTKTNGTLWAWGNDANQQLGNGTVAGNYASPTQIGTEANWTGATAGFFQSSAIKADGTFWAWGDTDLVGDGSSDVAAALQYSCNPLSLPQNGLVAVKLYPNPVRSWMVVEGAEIIAATAYDLSGRKHELAVQDGGLDVSGLSGGVYMLALETENGVHVQKFIKL